jgi:A/G-specific adenine glycosylase
MNASRKVEQRMDAEEMRRFRRSLVAWYDRAARDLPWRRTHDAYRIWISEIMLQQTTVVAVIPYFERFLARFPTVQDLAAAEEEQVLRLWEGLGYYSRARNLHRAARVVVEQYAGTFPSGVEPLHELPGVGRYTAGAIASFAFDERAPIVEANTQRLYCRLLGYAGDPKSAEGQRTLWQFAEDVLPTKQPGRFNQALMELGATVCTPKNPDCEACPVKTHCRALAAGLQHVIPKPAVRPETTDVTHAAAAIRHDGRWLLRQCGADERWAGLWDFPRIELDPADAPKPQGVLTAARTLRARMSLEQGVARLTGLEAEAGELFHQLRHTVTRYRIRLLCFHGAIRDPDSTTKLAAAGPIRWVLPEEFSELPLSMTGRKLADVVRTL